MPLWSQPLDPLPGIALSAAAAALPLAVVLIVMGWLRKPGYIAAGSGLVCSLLLACVIWGMPANLALVSVAYGFIYALWPIMWIVFAALWLYNLSVETGKFDLLRCWMEHHASGDMRVQAVMVAFCFGALLEGTAGFGAPVAVTAFLLLALGFKPNRAVTLSLIANTTPVAFGALGIPIVALAAVTGLDQAKLSAMVGRQLPFMSLLLPAYLIMFQSGRKGLKDTWPGRARRWRHLRWSPVRRGELLGALRRGRFGFACFDRRAHPFPAFLETHEDCACGSRSAGLGIHYEALARGFGRSLDAVGPAGRCHDRVVVFQSLPETPDLDSSALASQCCLHLALSQTVRCHLQFSASRGGNRRVDGGRHCRIAPPCFAANLHSGPD